MSIRCVYHYLAESVCVCVQTERNSWAMVTRCNGGGGGQVG